MTTEAVHLRRCRPGEADLMFAVHAACFETGSGEYWRRADIAAALRTPGTLGVLALDTAHHAVGYVLIRKVLDEAEILSIGVRPECRGNGVARTLLEFTKNDLKLSGVKKIVLEVREGNTPAIHLYIKMGFECVGRRAGYYKNRNGNRDDALTMRYIFSDNDNMVVVRQTS